MRKEAKRADAALKNPKKEREGATLRNNESLCNSLFPVNGPSVPLPQYIRYVDQYWDNLNALGRADGSRLRLLTYDIVLVRSFSSPFNYVLYSSCISKIEEKKKHEQFKLTAHAYNGFLIFFRC